MPARWQVLAQQRPDLAEVGRRLFYQFGVGLAFLATVRRDGGPRVHPICPLLTEVGLYVFVVPSPKRGDLERDSRYALHSYLCHNNEDAFYVSGHAIVERDAAVLESVRQCFLAERNWTDNPPPDWNDQQLFELLIERCLHTKTTGHADFNPVHVVWRPA